MLDKIDSNDITIQIESSKGDVAVPDGLATPRRNFDPNGVSFISDKGLGLSTSLNKDDIEFKVVNNELVYSWSPSMQTNAVLVNTDWDGKVSTSSRDGYVSSVRFSQKKDQDKIKTKPAGPVLLQNKLPIPVEAGQLVSMAGTISFHPIIEQQKDPDDNNTSVNYLVELYGVGYREDEYGEEVEQVLKLISYEVNAPGSMEVLNLQLPLNIGYVSVPYGIDRVFMCVSYKAVTTQTYLNVNCKLGPVGNRNIFRASLTDKFRVLIKAAPNENLIVDNRLSETTAAFKNRKIFSNLYPIFNYLNIPNGNFNSDFTGWTGATSSVTISTVSPHTPSKCVKFVDSGQIYGEAIAATPGERFYFSAWFRNIDFAGSGGLRLQKRIGSTWSDLGAGSPTIANSQWIKSELSAVVPAGADAIRLRFAFAGTGTIYLDDPEIAKLEHDNKLTFMGHSDPSTDYINIVNSQFEDGSTNWTGLNTAAGDTVDSTTSHAGTKSLKLVGNSQIHDASPAGYIDVIPGERYYAECWVCSDGVYSGAGDVQLSATISDNGSLPVYPVFYSHPAANLNSTWVKMIGIITIPPDKNRMVLRLSVRNTVTAGSYYFDEVLLARLNTTNDIPALPPAGIEINIYEWNGSRGNLIRNATAAVDERKVIDISSYTGSIEIERVGVPLSENYINFGMLTTLSSSGINKDTWYEIPNMIVDSAYLGTNIINNKLVVKQAGLVNLFPRGSFSYRVFGGTNAFASIQVKKNGAVVPNSLFTAAYSSKVSGAVTNLEVAVGDVISLEGRVYGTSNIYNIKFSPGSGLEMRYIENDVGPHLYVESLLANNWDYLDQDQNTLENVSYINITDDISSINIERTEADAGITTLKFCSDQLNPITNELLQVGKTIRILGRHYGNGVKERPSNWVGEALYETVSKVKIKKIRVEYDYQNEPQITVVGYDSYDKLNLIKLGVGFDTIMEYATALNSTGSECFIDGVEVSGRSKALPSNLLFFPSTYGQMTLIDSIIMARNTNMGYLYVDRNNRFIYRSSISSDTVKTVFTDGLLPGDLSVSDVGIEIDTESIVNIVSVEENLLDRQDFIERDISVNRPPELFKTIEGKTRNVEFEDRVSINNFGEYSKRFQVIRGNGSYDDLQNERYGDTYLLNSEVILGEYSAPKVRIASLSSPVKDSNTIKILSQMDLLDKIQVCYLGEVYTTRVRAVTHNIKPGGWTSKISFAPKSESTYW